MRVLVVTDVLWRDDNGVGNSYSNIFKDMPNVTIANICCQQGISRNSVSQGCFQISETSILKNLKNPELPSGMIEEKKEEEPSGNSGRFATFLKRSRLQIFFWMRNFIWRIGRWKSAELRKFIDDFKPDLIFAQLQDKIYLNNLVRYIQKYTQKPLCLYAWDDVYSWKQFSLSPLFWIDRFAQRCSIRKLVKQSSLLYTISDEQRLEYAKSLGVQTKLLYKGCDFNDDFCFQKEENANPIKILYTGNLYSGRYKTLKRICKALEKINKAGKKAELEIYSGSNLSKRQAAKLNKENVSRFCGKISESEVQTLQKEADILLHIEPFSLKGSLLCRLSFSTKLVDYFYNGKCIFATGHKRCSSMKYLTRFDAAVTVENPAEIKENLESLIDDAKKRSAYREKAWECGKNNHQIVNIQKNLLQDFNELI